jgi:ubiquinone/menaquinone biosynthesis C-methylase UbiE
MSAPTRFLRIFFYHLYHGLAWAYDLVAAAVSLGHWNDWVRSVIPFLSGKRVLELGHGPGHLQRVLRDRGGVVVGLDESRQMGRLAAALLRRRGDGRADLVRGVAQRLPFPAASFDSVVSTFPSEYIFHPGTLSEARRVLSAAGRLVILPAARPDAANPLGRLLTWLFYITGQATPRLDEAFRARAQALFGNAGFRLDIQQVRTASGVLLVIVATKY